MKSHHPFFVLLKVLLLMAFILSACAPATTTQVPVNTEASVVTASPVAAQPTEITVWDFYGDTTPIKPLIPAFEKENPGIKVKFEEVGWDGFWQKLPIAISSGEVPDVVTTGLMWAPEYKVSGAYADLMPLSGGKLNGKPFDEVLPKGSLAAARDGDKVYGIPYDFDAYALYYRADMFEAAGIKEVPTNWNDLAAALKKVAKPDKNVSALLIDPSWYGWDPYLYYFGGQYLDENGKAVFNSPQAIASINFMKQMVTDKTAVVWTADSGDRVSATKAGNIASFINGPWMMGVMRNSAPELSGKWKIALLPTDGGKAFGTHIGGVHLSVMAKSKHPAEAWKLIEFLMRQENQIAVWKTSGATPALLPALESSDVNTPDPYFSNQAAISIFKDTIKMGRPNPTIKDWTKINEIVNKALVTVLTTDADVQKTMDDAVAKANAILGK